MAKNVAIKEDGKDKIIKNVAKIRTTLSGAGTCDWIPKDDVPLQKLTVTEDGTYTPEEGYYGFSQVTARGIGNVTEGALIEKTITKNGTYNISDESGNPYGYSKIVVNVDTSDDSGDSGDDGGDSGGGITGKDEDGNDTMAETDDDGNIVMTALPTEIKVIIPPTKLEYNRYEEIDYSGISVYAYISKEIHWLGTTTIAVAEGSSDNTVSIGGSNVTASVGDGILYAPDRTGQNDVQLVWDGTKWVKPSNYSAEKAVWKSDKYPTGKIPFEELIFPMKRLNTSNEEYANNIVKEYDNIQIKLSNNNVNFISVAYGDVLYIIYGEAYKLYCGNYYSIGRETVHIPGPYTLRDDTIVDISMVGDGCVALFKNFGSSLMSNYINCTGEVIHPDMNAGDVSRHKYYDIYTVVAASKTIDFYISVSKTYSGVSSREPVSENSTLSVPSALGVTGSTYSPRYAKPGMTGYSLNGQVVYYTALDVVIPKTEYKSREDTELGVYSPFFVTNGVTSQSISGSINDSYWSYNIGRSAWIMIYGDEIENTKKIPVSLPVQWKRPGDDKILETTFTAWMKDDGSEASQGGDD